MFINPTTPNLADFLTFVQDQGFTAAYLTADSAYLGYSLNYALAVALTAPSDLGAGIPGYATPYVMACYNLGIHQLVKIAPDQTGQTTFSDARAKYNLLQFQAGPVIASSDQATSQTLAEPEFLKGLTISALDLLKTPWGRFYLDYAQQYGSTVVGVT